MYFIIYHDKSTQKVEDKIAKVLIERACDKEKKGVNIDGKMYLFSGISKILTEQDYYEQYPDKRPDTTPDYYSHYVAKGDIWNRATEKGKFQMLSGMARYIRDQKGISECTQARKLYEEFF